VREKEARRKAEAEAEGEEYAPEHNPNPVRTAVLKHQAGYPLERMHEIERGQQETRRERAAEAQAAASAPSYFLQAGVFGEPEPAVSKVTELVDAGYESNLITGEVGGVLLYEVRVGPFPTLDEAQQVGEAIRRSHDLAPSVMVEPRGEE
jgi:cell division protein FtsN